MSAGAGGSPAFPTAGTSTAADPARRYDRRQVTLGEQRGESNVAITQGLTGKETIVTHGALYLGAGGTAAD